MCERTRNSPQDGVSGEVGVRGAYAKEARVYLFICMPTCVHDVLSWKTFAHTNELHM